MSKLTSKRAAVRPASLGTVLRDIEYLKEVLHQSQLKAKVISTQLAEQSAETTNLQSAISEIREKMKRVRQERDQILTEKSQLAKELEQALKQTDLTKKKQEISSLESRMIQAKYQTAELKSDVEDKREVLERKNTLLQMRENEVKMMGKELEKTSKQRSILLDKAKMGSTSTKMPVKAVASKSQMETFWKESMTKGMQKEAIRPFNSYGFALNMNQSSGPIKVPPGLNTSRSSASKDPDPPSHRKTQTPDFKASSPSVE